MRRSFAATGANNGRMAGEKRAKSRTLFGTIILIIIIING